MKGFCPLLLLGLGAIALFVAGPQMGSFDDDNDGSPDVPVVVAVRNQVCDESRCIGKVQEQQKVNNSVVPALIGIQPRHPGIEEPLFAAHDGRSTLQAFCLLRC
jgi:hypothetical protein